MAQKIFFEKVLDKTIRDALYMQGFDFSESEANEEKSLMMTDQRNRKHTQAATTLATIWSAYAGVSQAMQPTGCPEGCDYVSRLNLAGQVMGTEGTIADRQLKT